MMGWALLFLSLALVVGATYWLIVLTEGAYLGPRVVTFLYDRGAGTYDKVKEFDAVGDAWDLARPLERRLVGVENPLILDVATGTGRLPLALLRSLEFEGHIVGLDASLKMLQEARRKTVGYGDRVTLLWTDALCLPYPGATFNAVTCVEALEFMADPRRGIREMVRVLRPGGTLLLTNRIGFDAFLMPGRTFSREQLTRFLGSLSVTSVEIKTWQSYYDLVWAKKDGSQVSPMRSEEPERELCCPSCLRPSLTLASGALVCEHCDLRYPVDERIICLESPRGNQRWKCGIR